MQTEAMIFSREHRHICLTMFDNQRYRGNNFIQFGPKSIPLATFRLGNIGLSSPCMHVLSAP